MTDRIPLDDMNSDQLDQLYDALDGAYRERAHLVAHLAALFPSHIGRTDPNAPDWPVLIIETPAGQMSWHINERDLDLFGHVQPTNRICRSWDGHSTEEKYERLQRLVRGEGVALFRIERAEAAIARVREYAATSDDDGIRTRQNILRIVGEWTGPETAPAGFAPFTPPHIPKTGDSSNALVVQPYRNDRGQPAWAFRCWGTDTCDGWLSLDHTSQQSAERARDRHVAEEHQPTEN